MLNPAAAGHEPIKVLAVDDRPENLIALQAALAGCGYELILAFSGQEALKRIGEHGFAAILLDVQMPEMDGFETARRIRERESDRRTPIIFITAIDRTAEFEHLGYIAGAVDYLFKPVSAEILKAKLDVFAELKRRNDESLRHAELLKEAALRDQENKLLREAVRVRDEFLSMASHELKTPITPLNLQLQAFLQMYKDGTIENVDRDRLIRLLQTSQDQVNRLSRLINDLVDVSRIKAGQLEITRGKTDLNDIVAGVLAAFAADAKRAGCEVRVTGPERVVGCWDRFRIEQVFINLLTNAIKYAPGKPIDVGIACRDGRAVLTVRDQGIGIAEDDQGRIFERFERAVSSRNYGGLGMGLFIASRIVRLHDGSIRVESGPGRGSTFIVELPVDPPAPQL